MLTLNLLHGAMVQGALWPFVWAAWKQVIARVIIVAIAREAEKLVIVVFRSGENRPVGCAIKDCLATLSLQMLSGADL